ncbi:MAG: DUF2865 domain-containing protein [Xanthobacteraceae bacterium]|nr:MAG: DUF2865 domain-containing protein [Xanthobacteraceae bacterium]
MPVQPLRQLSLRQLSALVFAALTGAASLAVCADARAQGAPPPPFAAGGPPGGNPVCQRLEGQLAAIDRGNGDSARAEQMRRYEDAASRQQGEIDRLTQQARRMGCESSGLFAIFGSQSAQCGPINSQIQQMRGNLDQIMSSLSRLRGSGGFEQDSQRRSVLLALAQNNCGPQYGAAARAGQPGGLLDDMFGGPTTPEGPVGNNYRTVCVRSCDGFYFPISFATTAARFADDEKACKRLCPAAEVALYSYRNPGEDMNQAVSINGQPYTQLPNAFKYRHEYNAACSCKAPGQTWAEALKNSDDRSSMEQGDILVTEERAKQMSQPRDAQGRPVRQPAGAKGTTPPAQAATPAANETPAAEQPNGSRPIRSVGPTFIPQR